MEVVYLQMTGACTLRYDGVLECTITDVTSEQVVTSSLRELKSDVHSILSQVRMCDSEGCNTRDHMRTMF